MKNEICYWLICFVPQAQTQAPKIFGFAEFISSLALLVIVFTVVDVRYRFRLLVTPTPLLALTFTLIGVIGAETLLTELWIAERWWVPKSVIITQPIWQVVFGTLFLATFLTWVYYAFIRPPIFGRRNARRYAFALYRVIVKGANSDLPVIADELSRSAHSLVKWCRQLPPRFSNEAGEADFSRKPGPEDYAHDVIALIANRKLCRHIIESSPATALAFFDAMAVQRKFDIPIGQFSKNISGEAISNKDSILYDESDEFSAGLLGRIQPFSQTVFGNFEMVEALAARFGSPLDVDFRERSNWDSGQWKVYCGATSTTLRAYLSSEFCGRHSFAIYQAFSDIESGLFDLRRLNEIDENYYQSDIYRRLDVIMDFIKGAIDLLDARIPLMEVRKLRQSRDNRHRTTDLYDKIAELIFDLIFAVSAVRSPPEKCWMIQRNAVWGEIFGRGGPAPARKIIQFKVRRLLYEEIVHLKAFPNFKGAGILGYCLNVLGFTAGTGEYGRDQRPLTRAVSAWVKREYLNLRARNIEIVNHCLIGSVTFDEREQRLVKTYNAMSGEEPARDFLELDGASPVRVLGPFRKLLRAKPALLRSTLER